MESFVSEESSLLGYDAVFISLQDLVPSIIGCVLTTFVHFLFMIFISHAYAFRRYHQGV